MARRLPAPICAPKFSLPTQRDLDSRLLGGAALFGLGWAVASLCPGPALANLSLALFGAGVARTAGVFCAAMATAMAAVDAVYAWRKGNKQQPRGGAASKRR